MPAAAIPPAFTARERELVEALLAAYRDGAFPMADPDGEIRFYSPSPRAIIPLLPGPAGFHVPRTLRARVRSARFTVTADRAFVRVIRACAAPRRDEPCSWIDHRIIHAYTLLHRAGHAHSLEAWRTDTDAPAEAPRLVGGLYGVRIAGAFFGESMFCRPDLGGTDASKVCLVHLVAHLRRRGFRLLDTQFANPHMERFGLQEISRRRYLDLLADALDTPASWTPFTPAPADADDPSAP